MRKLYIIIILFSFVNSCKKENNNKTDLNLIGKWQIDSIYTKSGYIYPSVDTWNHSNSTILLYINQNNTIEGLQYHIGLHGNYFITEIEDKIRINVSQNNTFVYIEYESKWLPICINVLNNTNYYKIKDNVLAMYSHNDDRIMFLTKK